MARREKLFLGSSLLHSFDDSLWFWTFLFATCCYRMHAKIIKYMLEKLTRMVPKWSQNLSKIDPGGGLEATWEPPLKQGASKTSFLMILAPFWDPLWDQFGLILGIIFLMFFWSGFLMALASIWAPKTPPKWDPRGGQNQKLKFIDFDSIFRGAENDHFSKLVWSSFLGWLLELIFMILAHFWGPFWRPFWSLFGYHFCIDF